MSDLIDRKAMLKELKEYMVSPEDIILATPDDVRNYNGGLLTAIQLVTDAPTIEQWQKKGGWMTNCGVLETTGLLSKCPHCGAKMEV